jgi:hypothetical protein
MTSLPSIYADAIKTRAQELTDHVAQAASTLRVLEAAEAHRGQIAERISALSTRREAIVCRRTAGTHDMDDGSSLALIQADLDGLRGLLPDAIARVAGAEAAYQASSAACSLCRGEIQRLESQAGLAALVDHAGVLAAKLMDTIRNIAAAEQQAGISGLPSWGAPKELYLELRALAAKRGEL